MDYRSLVRRAPTTIGVLIALWLAAPAVFAFGQTPSAAPAPPEIIGVNGSLTWRDNSDNEDGFRVEIVINGETHAFIVGPNVTRFEFPAELHDQCGERPRYNVASFNEAGDALSMSTIGSTIFISECPGVLQTPTPAPKPPAVGGLSERGTAPPSYIYILAGAGATLLAVGWSLRQRSHPG